MVAQSVGDWAEKQRFLIPSPNADKTWEQAPAEHC